MHSSSNQLLSRWIVGLVKNEFNRQKSLYADKLFMKIQGMDDSVWPALLDDFEQRSGELGRQYLPVIRTMLPLAAYPAYSCQAHETSTWLRNNTSSASALIILMNNQTAEAQSLENIYTIDEARLLSIEGLDILYQVLGEQYRIMSDDLEAVRNFLTLFGKIAEPQLRNLLSFLARLVTQDSEPVLAKIQRHLDELQLFRDRNLILTGPKGLVGLQRNYQLARLEQSGRPLDREQLFARATDFVEKNGKEYHELWETVEPDVFLQQVYDFINRVSHELYRYEYKHIAEMMNFKEGKAKFPEQINQFKQDMMDADRWSPERDTLLTKMQEAIEDKQHAETVREFLDELADELIDYPRLKREIERNEARIRHTNEYTELTEALRQECVLLLEKYADEQTIARIQFTLRLTKWSIEADQTAIRQAWGLHLLNLDRLTGYIRFDEKSLEIPEVREKDNVLQFELDLMIDGKKRETVKFQLTDAMNGLLPMMLQHYADNGCIPYIQEFIGQDTRPKDIRREAQEQVSAYTATHEEGFAEALSQFIGFMDLYKPMLDTAIQCGLASLDFDALTHQLTEILKSRYCTAKTAPHIFHYINRLGAYDIYNCRISESAGTVQERVLTILNPIRLISYAQRLGQLKDIVTKWTGAKTDHVESMDGVTVYLQQMREQTEQLSPRYFAVDGMPDSFLIEHQERMGEGRFAINGASEGEDQLVGLFTDELQSAVKSYLEVYPYAKDCIDLIFLFCPHADYVEKSIDRMFREFPQLHKVRAVVHSQMHGAVLFDRLNNWLSRSEQYGAANSSFPRVEIQVLAEQELNAMMNGLTTMLHDADIGILVNYFGQTSHITYKLERVQTGDTNDWFHAVYKEPVKKDDAVKRISYVSEKLPPLLRQFYRLQYMLNSSQTPMQDEDYLLQTIIAIGGRAENTVLLDFMHDKFNWSLFVDRYLDKPLLRKVSAKAQIIKYKSRVGDSKSFRTLISSSKYVQKLAKQLHDHEFYERLHHKIAQLLQNRHLSKDLIVNAVMRVQDISGGIVMRAIGPGKFAHEMVSMYLATDAPHRAPKPGEMVVWSVCDELPWFNNRGRRPDLVRTAISLQGERLRLRFELVELKFIKEESFENERMDATKQVKAGVELYKSNFDFEKKPISAQMWRQELVHYLLEFGEYSPGDAQMLKQLQTLPLSSLDIEVDGSIDTFVYDSNLYEQSLMKDHVDGYATELLMNEYPNHIYNRAYILRALGADREQDVPVYDELIKLDEFVLEKLGIDLERTETVPPPVAGNVADEMLEEAGSEREAATPEAQAFVAATLEESVVDKVELLIRPEASGAEAAPVASADTAAYPEVKALRDVEIPSPDPEEDVSEFVSTVTRKLFYNFNQLGIRLRIVDVIVGVSVIRLIAEVPVDVAFNQIASRAREMEIWLELSSIPIVHVLNGKITIDINRDRPETIYFDRFMSLVRETFSNEKLRGKLIAPLGIGQLREVVATDFSDSLSPHLLVGGTTGSGKSVTLNAIILSTMCLYNPSEVQFLFLDPKKVEFSFYENWPHTRKVITEIEEAISALEQIVQEMEDRYELLMREGVDNISQYVEETGQNMPRLLVVFDEFADFMEREKSQSSRVENAIVRLGQKARAAGIHLLICTQSPRSDIVPTNIRNNLPARLALKAADHHASKLILTEEGAEMLGGKGDFLAKLSQPKPIRAKSPFLTPRVKRALRDYFKQPEPILQDLKG